MENSKGRESSGNACVGFASDAGVSGSRSVQESIREHKLSFGYYNGHTVVEQAFVRGRMPFVHRRGDISRNPHERVAGHTAHQQVHRLPSCANKLVIPRIHSMEHTAAFPLEGVPLHVLRLVPRQHADPCIGVRIVAHRWTEGEGQDAGQYAQRKRKVEDERVRTAHAEIVHHARGREARDRNTEELGMPR